MDEMMTRCCYCLQWLPQGGGPDHYPMCPEIAHAKTMVLYWESMLGMMEWAMGPKEEKTHADHD